MTPIDQLQRIVERGAPAQRDEAIRILAVLGERPSDSDGLEAAQQLIEAYLHDPYLERG